MVFLIIAFSALLIFILFFSKGISSLRYLFYFWILCFHFGPRGEEIFGIKIFYLEGITWLLFFLLILRFNFFAGKKNVFPKYTTLLFLFFILGIYTAIYYENKVENIIWEFKVFLTIIPTFYISYIGFKYLNINIKRIIQIFVLGALILTLGSVLFYFFPSLSKTLPTFEDSVIIDTHQFEVTYTEEPYIRTGGSFWGLLIISAYLLLLFFPIYIERGFQKNIFKKYLYLVTNILIIIVSLLNGHRSIWLGFLLGWAIFSYIRGFKGIFWGFILTFVILHIIPQAVIDRFFSIFQVSDITWTGRVSLFEKASGIIKEHPIFGVGWAGSGWVHNFILQMGANLGLIGLFVFLLWLFKLFSSSFFLYRKLNKESLKSYLAGFLVSCISYLMPMTGEALIEWPSFMIPFWFFLAVLHNFYIIVDENKIF